MSSSSAITSHAYRRPADPWERCELCGLSEAAHAEVEGQPYRILLCVECGADLEPADDELCARCVRELYGEPTS